MIHPKSPSVSHNRPWKKRPTTSAKAVVEAAQTVRLDERAAPQAPINDQESDVLGFFEAIEHEKAQAEMAKMLEKRKLYPIAPDALIPNSILRSMFQMKELEPAEVKMFRLRLVSPTPSDSTTMDFDERLKRYSVLTNFDGIRSTISQSLNQIDILDNLQSKTNKNLNWQNDDDEWIELRDPDDSGTEATARSTSSKQPKNVRSTTDTLISRQKDTLPDIFKRLKKEAWWGHVDEEESDSPRSMLLYLIDVLRDKERDSYESACNYVVEIFRTYGIEPVLANQILGVLIDHLALSENDPLDLHTVRTIGQFMIERKDIIIALLAFTSKCPPDDILRHETINAIKFITDVNNSDDIDLVLNNMPIVRDAADDTFSLKTIIERIKAREKKVPSHSEKKGEQDEGDVLHPLLKKISEERWFPRDLTSITLDSVIDAILTKLPNASKTMLKTLTTNLVQLHRTFGYSNEQYDRVSNGLIALLSHNDADYRLIAATVLAELGRETKVVDVALLNAFLNDARILVRTECCDSLKKITGIMSDTVLKDCADDLAYLQTLSGDDFSLQNYLKEKNRLPTPSPPPSVSGKERREEGEETELVDGEEEEGDNMVPTHEDEHVEPDVTIDDSASPLPPSPLPPDNNRIDDTTSPVRSPSPSPYHKEQPSTQTQSHLHQPTPSQFSIAPSTNSSTTPLIPLEPSIRVEINEKGKPSVAPSQPATHPRRYIPSPTPPPPSSSEPTRARQQPTEFFNRTSIKITLSEPSTGRRYLLLPNTTEMWDSYAKQNGIDEETESEVLTSTVINQEQLPDPIQTILNDHKRHIGYYRMMPNRSVLVPHKVSFDDVFGDQSHLTVDRPIPRRAPSRPSSTMHLSDLNRNRYHLEEVEFVQLLSSLVVRAIQVHKKHERLIPGPFSTHTDSTTTFTDALTISQVTLHSLTNLGQATFYMPSRFPPIVKKRPSSAEMRSDVHSRAKRIGINLRKTRDMENVLSHLLQTDREHSRSTLAPTNTSHSSTLGLTTDSNEITHAWLLEQLLKSQGAPNSQNYIHQIIRAYPKFTPLLHSRIPRDLIPIIWNDPVLKQLASIISNKPDESPMEDISPRRAPTKASIPTFDDEHSSNFFDYTASNHLLSMQQQQRDEHKKGKLPAIQGVKMHLPRHVLKFGYRELETNSSEASPDSLRDEKISKSRRRRLYMHLMMSVNENMLVRHELVKSQFRHLLKTDYRPTAFVPITSKAPVCH